MIPISSLSKATEFIYNIYIKESLKEDTAVAQKWILKVCF